MTKKANIFNPDYGVPPGWIIEDYLESKGWSQTELAQRCGKSPELIAQIIAAEKPITPEIALLFEQIFEVPKETWLNLEMEYQSHLEKEKIKKAG